MRMRFFSAFSTSNLPLLTSSQNIHQGTNITSLDGIKEVRIDIGLLSPILKSKLSEQQIQIDVESKLRTAEIRVVSEPELYIPHGPVEEITPLLSVKIDAMGTDSLISFIVEILLWEWVHLRQNRKLLLPVIIWHETTLGTVGKGNLRQIRDLVKERIDKFTSDFLTVNTI